MKIEENKVGIFRWKLAKPWRCLRRFSRNQDGATAIEFAIVALPFFAFLFAILETGLIFFAGQTLETAVSDSARLILTGQAQSGGFKAEDFQKAVCDRITGLIDCSKVYIDVRKFSSFSGINFDPVLDEDGHLTNDFKYEPGGAGDIIVVRLLYEFPVRVQLWNPQLVNMSGNNRLIIATAAFRNEPF